MKIALVHYATHPVIGGVERIIRAHARLLRRHGHEVTIISQRGDADFTIEPGGKKERYLHDLRSIVVRLDLVVVHNVMTMPFDLPLTQALAELAQNFSGPRWIAWVHDVAAANPDLQPTAKILHRAAQGFEYVAVSALRARQFEEVTSVTAQVIPNGIDPAEILDLPVAVTTFADRHHLFDGRPILLHPTRLLRRKNVELGLSLIQAMRASGAVLLVTGAEDPHNSASLDYATWLRAERERLGVADRVIFIGDELDLSDETVAALYRVADGLFFPSRQEGFGLPILEAALHRMPCFYADIVPLTDLLGPNARRFELTEEPTVIAEKILETLKHDPSTLARKQALSYRWDRIYKEHLEPLVTGAIPKT